MIAMSPSTGDYVLANYRGQGILRLCLCGRQHPVWGTWLLTAENWSGNSETAGDNIKWVFGSRKPSRREIHEAQMRLRDASGVKPIGTAEALAQPGLETTRTPGGLDHVEKKPQPEGAKPGEKAGSRWPGAGETRCRAPIAPGRSGNPRTAN